MKSATCQLLTIVLFCVAALAGSQSVRAQKANASLSKEQVLDRWSEALGGRRNLQSMAAFHLRGSIETGGLKGTYERWATSRGDFRNAVDLSGAFRQASVFDGQTAWTLDTSGTVHEASGDVLKSLVSAAYEASDSFLFPGRIPGQVDLVNEASNQDVYVLRLEPQNGIPITVYLDAKTFLPIREETNGAMGSRTISFSDWRDFDGVKFPGTVHQSNGNSKFDTVITTDQVEINPPVVASLFEKPGSAAEQIDFTVNAHEAILPAQVYGDHIFLPVRVNGGSGAWFFLDSGAGISVVSSSWARKVGLTSEGAIKGQGTGAGSTSLALAKNVVLDLTGARVPPSTIAVWDFSSLLPALGRQWDGVLGYDVISRVVVRVDYERQQITLYDPATFTPDAHATVLPVTFLGNLPLVQARMALPGRAPVDTVCAIDSGADGFHLSTPFTNANHVLDSVQKKISASAIGAGGDSKEFAGRIAGLQLGPYLLREPIAAFSPDSKEGLLASSDIGALIGGSILKRFTVTFDFPHRRIFLEPNRHFSDPFRENESGLSLLAKGADFHTFEVDGVEPGSPSELADIQKGDILAALDGHSASELDLPKINELLEPSGRAISITILRNGQTFKMTLNLTERL